MICQACGKKTATTHIKAIVNGQLTEYHLCGDCAKEKGYTVPFSEWGLPVGSFLSGLMGAKKPNKQVLRCPTCGASFEEVTKTGNVGCADCYRTFRDQLLPVIQRIHGTASHKGKVPGGAALRVTDGNHAIMPVDVNLEEKKRQMQKAVEAQDFERAAQLRDEIKEMEQHG